MTGRIYHARNRWKLTLVLGGCGFVLAAGLGFARDVWLDRVSTANCQEIEQLKTYVRDTIKRSGRLRDSLDFRLSPHDLDVLKRQDGETLRKFRREPCPRTD